MSATRVHLVRHGEVNNPQGILYGRLPGYGLTERGARMAHRIAEHFSAAGVTHLVASPLQRAQETVAPLAATLDLPVHTDERVIEADSVFEGLDLGPNPAQLAHPRYWRYLINPFTPSWGEPNRAIVTRMRDAIRDARAAAEGHEAVIVSHQNPIWTTRLALEGRSFVHDPRRRQCTLASVTSLTFDGGTLVGLDYSEPAGDLLVGAEAIT
ncbi:histidine phosphatase family protein [Pseudactinotalea sp.]|uniref:histidine phosphatase family protein n=1 Tax=Pseudactinotalea sp. TaxID=1926260 RepID=UPI003B3AE310